MSVCCFGREKFRLQRTGCNRLRFIFDVPASRTLVLLTALHGMRAATPAAFAAKSPSVLSDGSQLRAHNEITASHSLKSADSETRTTGTVARRQFSPSMNTAEPFGPIRVAGRACINRPQRANWWGCFTESNRCVRTHCRNAHS